MRQFRQYIGWLPVVSIVPSAHAPVRRDQRRSHGMNELPFVFTHKDAEIAGYFGAVSLRNGGELPMAVGRPGHERPAIVPQHLGRIVPVSYTHLTLPTSDLV